MSETIALQKKFIITVDMVTGSVTYHNADDLSYMETLGAIEFIKMMITKQYLEDAQSES